MTFCLGCGWHITYDVSNRQNGLCDGCYKILQAKPQARAFNQFFSGGIYNNMAYRRSGYSSPYTQQSGSSSTNSQCSFTWDVSRLAYAIKADYQPNFIEFIKAKIPGSDRAWDPASKTWWVKDAWFDIMFELASQLWPGAVACVTRAQAEQAWKEQEAARTAMLAAQRQAVLGPFESALLEFCALCDLDALKAARNKMAIALHPDKQGGDANAMAKLNASWFLIETEFKKRSEAK